MDLIGRKVFQHLAHATGPAYFKLLDGLEVAEPEVRTRIARSSVACARRDNVKLAAAVLGGYLELSSYGHAVALRALQLESYPVIAVWRHVAKDPGPSIQGGNNKIHVSVVKQITDNRAAIRLRNLHVRTRLRRYILKLHFAQVAKN